MSERSVSIARASIMTDEAAGVERIVTAVQDEGLPLTPSPLYSGEREERPAYTDVRVIPQARLYGSPRRAFLASACPAVRGTGTRQYAFSHPKARSHPHEQAKNGTARRRHGRGHGEPHLSGRDRRRAGARSRRDAAPRA